MFRQALERALKRLDNAKNDGLLADFALIGGLALSRWSKPRATQDIDFAISMDSRNLEPLAAFLQGNLRQGGPSDPLEATITYEEHHEVAPIEVQLVQFPPAIEAVAFEGVDQLQLQELTIPVVDWKALVLLKLYAGGQADLLDAESVLEAVAYDRADRQYLEAKARTLRLDRRLKKLLKNARQE